VIYQCIIGKPLHAKVNKKCKTNSHTAAVGGAVSCYCLVETVSAMPLHAKVYRKCTTNSPTVAIVFFILFG